MLRWLILLSAGLFAWALFTHFDSVDRAEVPAPHKLGSVMAKSVNPAGLVPRHGFRAYYFDRNNRGKVVSTEYVEDVAINYAYADFHRIDSRDFEAYWIGLLRYSEATTQQISVSQGWANSRILIDGKSVFQGGTDATFKHTFAPGEHVIEVEYGNHWHTTEFKMTLQDVVRPRALSEISQLLQATKADGGKLYYAGIYESEAKNNAVRVDLPPSGRPAVVWLYSHSAIDWTISSPTKIAAVIVSASSPGSRVFGKANHVYSVEDAVRVNHESRDCRCAGGGYYRCENTKGLSDVRDMLQKFTGMTLDGYATQYSARDLAITVLDDAARSRIDGEAAAIEAARRQCVAR